MVYVILGSLVLLSSVVLFVSGGLKLSYWNYFFSSPTWGTGLIIDNCSMCICLMLLLCFSLVLVYIPHYFGGGDSVVYLTPLITVFVGTMGGLVFTGDTLLTLILWEYLGVVSFFLILFYLSYLSLRASVVTLVSSRFGDVCLFVVFAAVAYLNPNPWVLCCCFIFIICTKSASFPFISWLLEAMRAPTPVSSLVHSSTLVAAGVWFSLRYGISAGWGESNVMFVLLMITVIITGVASFFFFDLKKIVALSTCNNINWCLIYLILGGFWLSLFQLICHGVSKCLLFMLVGDVMSGTGGSQASNYAYSPSFYGGYGSFGLVCVILGLSGAPFIGVFFTKHFMLSTLVGVFNATTGFCVFIGVLLSYLYSFRLCRMLISVRASAPLGVLYTCASFSITYWWLFLNFFGGATEDEHSSLSGVSTQVIWGFQLLACLVCWAAYSSVILTFCCSSLFGVDNLVEGVYASFLKWESVVRVCLFRWDSYCLNLHPSSLSWASIRAINPIIGLIVVSLGLMAVMY
uniref:NADH:ubiquinone reductase (H(+)-translocating) n=1 Tax=Khawia sinensis TaxID=125900 RepID=A0A1W5J4L8_9CEST|nr:NADH dehydrogenase subunit 5 [Khawia sinensis]ALK26539.1 NADH dehydrogenase subunit 5 [Khawia sinensis]